LWLTAAVRTLLHTIAAVVVSAAWLPVHAAPVTLLPLVTGTFGAGSGADAAFYQIDSNWHGSSVLWDETTGTYGSGVPIGTLPWGTGLWGRADWQTIQQTAGGPGSIGAPTIVNAWSGVVGSINFANAVYNADYAGTWGAASLLPFFGADGAQSEQENWTARFGGYIHVTEAGAYDFSVLNDDGFFFRLAGAGNTLEIGRDYLNPRERNGFDTELLLAPGLYGFELGQWNRLEAGVVDLRWQMPGSDEWTLVPTSNLLPQAAVPEPAPLALVALALLMLARQRRAPA
jgi:hypothetical protein